MQQEVRVVLWIVRRIQPTTVGRVHPVDQGPPGRRSLKSKLRAEPGNLAAVRRVVNAVPDLPLVMRPMVGIVGMHTLPVHTWGIWTVIAIRPSGIKLGHNP